MGAQPWLAANGRRPSTPTGRLKNSTPARALEAGRWDDAERLAKSVLKLMPDNATAKRKLELIRQSRRKQNISRALMAVTDAINQGKPVQARKQLARLHQLAPENPNIDAFSSRINDLEVVVRKRHTKAESLYQQAAKLDTGEFSSEAMALLDEARRLHPESAAILALHQKMGSYTRAIKVPADYPTITGALEAARPRNVIRVAPGTYKEAVVIDKPVRLVGSADGKTVIELPAKEAGLVTITAAAAGARVSGFVLRHTGFDHSSDRYAAVTVEAAGASITSCNIEHAAGHGVAVVDGAKVRITGCKVRLCGWDGISVYGNGSEAEITEVLSLGNLQNGIGFWHGGSGKVSGSRMLKNGLCGIVAMSKGAEITLTSNTCSANREAGILLSDAVSATLTSNLCEKNLLSGIVARSPGTSVALVNNVTKGNHEAGILTHFGVKIRKFENNRSSGNTSQQIWRDAKLESPKEAPPQKK